MIYGACLDDNLPLHDIVSALGDISGQFNWLISDYQLFSSNDDLIPVEKDYIWLNGDDFRKLLDTDLFAVWCVISAFPKNVALEDVLEFDLPYADGNPGFWVDDVSLQTPLTELEIVVFDSSSCFILSKYRSHRDRFLNAFPGSYDLISNNIRTNAIIRTITDEICNLPEYSADKQFPWRFYHAILNDIPLEPEYNELLEKCKLKLKQNGLIN